MKTLSAFDASAFESLYRAHLPWLSGWLRRRLGSNPAGADDLAQDVFVRVLAGRKDVRTEQAREFLSTIARGVLIDHHRRVTLERAYLDYLASQPSASQPSPETRLAILQQVAALDRMLAGLPDNARRAFLLAQVDGLSYAEVAQRLGVSLSSVQQYMTRALTACYLCLED